MKRGFPKCEWCGHPFEPKRPWQRFCRKPCHDAWWQKHRKEMQEYWDKNHEEEVIHESIIHSPALGVVNN